MGGRGYNRDVRTGSISTRDEFNFVRDMKPKIRKEENISPYLDPKKASRNGWECREVSGVSDRITAIVFMNDLTLTRGDDIRIMFNKLPLLMGQVVMRNFADIPQVSICGVGDCLYDRFPIQIGDFESDLRIDRNLKALKIEEGGGGNGVESYATALYGYAYHSHLDCNDRGEKGFLFISGDEGFYPTVSKQEIKQIYGIDVPEDISSERIFADVQKKYHTFFIYCLKKWEDRKKGIDAEIKKRVKERGGMYEGVDVRASLMWNTCDDLDLHVIAPSGEEIYFSHMRSRCGGELDVDTNAGGCRTRKAVENIRWPRGKAPAGRYQVFVRNFAYHDPEVNGEAIPFKVELEVDGNFEQFEGRIERHTTGQRSDVVCFEFDYDSEKKKEKLPDDPYAAYADEKIMDQWQTVLPEENILVIKDPNAIMDTMIGAIAMKTKKRTADEYVKDMNDWGQSETRCAEVRETLDKLGTADSKQNRPDATKLPKRKKK
jgi:hypothetical protein